MFPRCSVLRPFRRFGLTAFTPPSDRKTQRRFRRARGATDEDSRLTALLIDFGSTYTKLRAVTLEPPRIVAAAQGPSTVDSDITVGMELQHL